MSVSRMSRGIVCRTGSGWSRPEFARMLGLGAQTVAEILGGDRPITSDLAWAIGDVLGTGAQLRLNLQGHPLSRRE